MTTVRTNDDVAIVGMLDKIQVVRGLLIHSCNIELITNEHGEEVMSLRLQEGLEPSPLSDEMNIGWKRTGQGREGNYSSRFLGEVCMYVCV